MSLFVSWPNRQEAEPNGTLLMLFLYRQEAEPSGTLLILLYRDRSGLREDRGPTGAHYNCHTERDCSQCVSFGNGVLWP